MRDGGVSETGGAADPGQVRVVTDVATLKALADPLRLAILAALMRGADPRIMSVKELAAELGESQTKLYRHVKQLESAGLIRVAASRLVSGILEQRYQACQTDLRLGPGLMRDEAAADDGAALIAVLFDQYRERFIAASAAAPAEHPPGPSYRRPLLSLADTRLPPARAAAIRDRLQEIIDELDQTADETEDGVPVDVLIAFFSPSGPERR